MRPEDIKTKLIFYGHQPRMPNEVYVTDLLYCPRKAWFSIKFLSNPLLPEPGRPFVGRILHEKLPDILGDLVADRCNCYHFERELREPLTGSWSLVGKADLVCRSGTEIQVYEFKFTRLVDGSKFDDILPVWSLQANIYANMVVEESNRVGVFKIGDCVSKPGPVKWNVVAISPDTLDVRTVSGDAELNSYEMAVDRAKDIISSVEGDTVPDGPLYDWECKKCPFRTLCEKMGLIRA